MTKQFFFLLFCALLSLPIVAQTSAQTDKSAQYSSEREGKSFNKTSNNKIFTGFSGGMMLHIGYAFSQSPDELFRNSSLLKVQNLSREGLTLGLGGVLRLHLYDHMHVGAEGFVSTMPLMSSGSSIRTGWGGALIDGYFTLGRISPLLGVTIGGGTMKRLYIPTQEVKAYTEDDKETIYNASFTQTSFFLLDPYVGIEIALNSHTKLLVKVDYALPFGKKDSGIGETLQWSSFLRPSGPRLHIGAMFGK